MWGPFWVLPSLICAGAFGLALLLPLVDRSWLGDADVLFSGNAESARSLLGTIATAMISVTGLVFSITMVVIQLASSQFTPRLLGSFLGNRIVQVTLGVFTSSFVFALVVMREVRAGEDPFVPQLSVTMAFVLVIASVAMFFAFIHHITRAIQVDHAIDAIEASTASELQRGWDDADRARPPIDWDRPDSPGEKVTIDDQHGVVQRIGYRQLIDAAERGRAVVELTVRPGEVHHRGNPVAVLHRAGRAPAGSADADQGADDLAAAVRAAIGLGQTRSIPQDPAFGVRQLVDIADRALSPGINDPTTAVQVLDELNRLLRISAGRPDPSRYLLDGAGTVRVVDDPVTFAELLDLALDEIAHYGADSVQIPPRIDALLADLDTVATPEQRTVVSAKRAQLTASS
nr:DUF2254 domain-containing protein [Nakamurella aerolata]